MTRADRPLRIAMIGQRGLPATYGGVEKHVEEISARLASRGHDVTVWCRTAYVRERRGDWRGARLRYLPAVPSKGLEALSHSALSAAASLLPRPDIVHYHAVGPGLVAPLSRWVGRTGVVLSVHGLDAERAKWGSFARRVLRMATVMSARVPHRTVTVSQSLADHYAEHLGRLADVIPNGVTEPQARPVGPALRRLGLEPGRYVLFVGRLVPEKAPDALVRAFLAASDDAALDGVRLVVAGGCSFTAGFSRHVHGLAAGDPRVVMPGYVYGDDLAELYANAGLFVLPSLLEGLPLTLLEACAAGAPVLASDIPPHREVLRSDRPGGRLFAAGDEAALTQALCEILRRPRQERAGAAQVRREVLQRYSWDRATDALEAVYRAVVRSRTSPA